MRFQAPPRCLGPTRTWTVDDATQLGAVRRALGRHVADAPSSTAPADDLAQGLTQVTERLVLVASELITNALRYGAPPVQVSVGRLTHAWLLVVADQAPHRAPQPQAPDLLRTGGRGLPLVDVLSERWGWSPQTTAKQVWAVLGDGLSPALRRLLSATSTDDAEAE